MNQISTQNFLTKNVSALKGVGTKTKKLLKKKNIEKIKKIKQSETKNLLKKKN